MEQGRNEKSNVDLEYVCNDNYSDQYRLGHNEENMISLIILLLLSTIPANTVDDHMNQYSSPVHKQDDPWSVSPPWESVITGPLGTYNPDDGLWLINSTSDIHITRTGRVVYPANRSMNSKAHWLKYRNSCKRWNQPAAGIVVDEKRQRRMEQWAKRINLVPTGN